MLRTRDLTNYIPKVLCITKMKTCQMVPFLPRRAEGRADAANSATCRVGGGGFPPITALMSSSSWGAVVALT